jgi:hypothetical protein
MPIDIGYQTVLSFRRHYIAVFSPVVRFGRPHILQFIPEGLTGNQCCQIGPDCRPNLAQWALVYFATTASPFRNAFKLGFTSAILIHQSSGAWKQTQFTVSL